MKLPGILLFALLGSSSLSAAPAPGMLQTCDREMKKYACEASSESYAYQCLYKHKESREKNKGFSAGCFKAYALYEKDNGKQERIDSHQVEKLEHAP